MNKINYYKNGKIETIGILNKNTLQRCHGAKIKCILLDGTEKVGYANTYYSFVKGDVVLGVEAVSLEYITLETFINLDEESHEFVGGDDHKYDIYREMVLIELISHVDVLLYSGLSWCGFPTNKFQI